MQGQPQLPPGWRSAMHEGRPYYIDPQGTSHWELPQAAAAAPAQPQQAAAQPAQAQQQQYAQQQVRPTASLFPPLLA